MRIIKTIKLLLIGILTILFLSQCGEKTNLNSAPSTNSNQEVEDIPKSPSQTKDDAIVNLSPQQKLGKRLFIMCEACHNVNKGDSHKVGPNLHGVFGRKAGTEPGFVYSESVLNSNIIWSDETIRSWLKDPNDYIPGTNMVFVGLQKKHQQDALLEYLHFITK